MEQERTFKFHDTRYEKIYEDLRFIGEGPAYFFRDACLMKENPENLRTTSHLIGHCIREIESALRDALKPIAVKEEGLTHKAQIDAIVDTFFVEEKVRVRNLWINLVGLLSKFAHRDNLNPPRPIDKINGVWENFITLLEQLLPEMRKNIDKWFKKIDEIVEDSPEKGLNMLIRNIPNNLTIHRYFFKEKLKG
ncbi:MAG: hypothetical protein ACPLRS_05030, partial [Hydrogenobacter sp.]